MIATAKKLTQIRPHYTPDTEYLFRILLNATSSVEAGIALDLLLKSLPERLLITAVNLREVIKSLPPSPFPMAIDEATLIRVAGLKKHLASLSTCTADDYEIVITTGGNLVLDLIVKTGNKKFFWTPVPRTNDLICPELVSHIIKSEFLLDAVIELITNMGLVFNPTLYLSLEDWHLDYSSDAMAGLDELLYDTDA